MKILKFICVFISCVLLFVSSLSALAISDEEITAPSAVLMEAKTGKILYEKNSHEIRACASITKVMTLILIMEAIDSGEISLDDNVTASVHASSMGGSDIWLEEGEVMSVNDLIKATVVASANDAAVALAEYVAGSEDTFVDNMNAKAKALNMNDTVFKNCNGLDEEGHLTSAHDVALMSRELIKHKIIYNYTSIWMDNLRNGKTQIVNTNKLLKSYNGITGLKTGTTNEAGSCISATAKRNDLELISVVLGSKTGKDRFRDAALLLDYGFANFTMTSPIMPEEFYDSVVKVNNGMESTVNTQVRLSGDFLIPKGREKDIKSNLELLEEVEAPVYKDQKLGTVTFSLDNEILAQYSVTALSDVQEISFKSVLSLLTSQIFKL